MRDAEMICSDIANARRKGSRGENDMRARAKMTRSDNVICAAALLRASRAREIQPKSSAAAAAAAAAKARARKRVD